VFDAPDSIKDPSTISRLLHEILGMLDKVKKKEAKDALKKGNKQIQNEGDSDTGSEDDDDESSEDDYDDEDEGEQSEDLKKNGKRSRGNSDGMMDDEETKKPFGFTDDAAEEGKSDEDSDDDEYDCQVSRY
jgi:hypothetical protein